MKYCPVCQRETHHKEVIKQKPSKYGKSRKEQFKAFLDGFIGGSYFGGLSTVDLIDRYVVCQSCGHSRLENEGEEFL